MPKNSHQTNQDENPRKRGVRFRPFALFVSITILIGAIVAIIVLAVMMVLRGDEIHNLQNAETLSHTMSPHITCLRGQSGLTGDWTSDAPGVCRYITSADLPPPYETSNTANGPSLIQRPTDVWPEVPVGFQVHEFLPGPRGVIRLLRTAPNGDIFIAKSDSGQILIMRAAPGAAEAENVTVFASGLQRPFGITFFPPGDRPEFIYVATAGTVVRYPYSNGDSVAAGDVEVIVPDLPYDRANPGHWTRDVVFSADGAKMYVSVGSLSNAYEVGTGPSEINRAAILEYNPDGSGFRIFASGIRNPVTLAINPTTGQLWTSVDERDGRGDDLVPDYVTHVQNGGFYGWPWYYIGSNPDPIHLGRFLELRDKVIIPDVLIQSHSAALQMIFYDGRQFPEEYTGDAFVALHGSWNRARRTGYKVVRVTMKNGVATGSYTDFMTGFVTNTSDVWGRPVGVTVARDGSLLVSEDGHGTIWRVSYGANEN